MSRRIAHRPRYHNMRQLVQPQFRSRQSFLRTRWTYRRQKPAYEKRALAYGLSLISASYRFIPAMLVR